MLCAKKKKKKFEKYKLLLCKSYEHFLKISGMIANTAVDSILEGYGFPLMFSLINSMLECQWDTYHLSSHFMCLCSQSSRCDSKDRKILAHFSF